MQPHSGLGTRAVAHRHADTSRKESDARHIAQDLADELQLTGTDTKRHDVATVNYLENYSKVRNIRN